MSAPPTQQIAVSKNVISADSIRDLFYIAGRADVKVDSHVEECVARMTNEFVDTVIEHAASMAKMRNPGREVALEPRDIDITISNLYGLSLPGVASPLTSTVTAAATKRKRHLRTSVLALDETEREEQSTAWGSAMHLSRTEKVLQETLRNNIRADRKKKKKRDEQEK